VKIVNAVFGAWNSILAKSCECNGSARCIIINNNHNNIITMIFTFYVLLSVCVEKSYKFKRDSWEEARWFAITTKGPVETKAEGVTFNSNSMFWIWATEHSDTLHWPLFLNVISHWIKVTLLFNKLRPRHGFLKNNKCPKPPFLFRLRQEQSCTMHFE